jgi:pimeloyl-ACP methyl ester carboxylesterase
MSSINRAMAMATLAIPLCGGSPLAAQLPQSASTGPRFEETHVPTPDGVRLYVRVLGNGPDTVVIGSVAYLAQDLVPLESGRTLIFYDPRSRGGSDAVLDSTRLGMEYEVDDIEAIRAHFQIDRFSLIGWSYLGAVVALYAAKHPEHVQAVVQIGPMAPRALTFRTAQRVVSTPDSADLAFLAQLRQAGVPASDPVRYCREYVLRQMLRPMMGRRHAATMIRADPCMYWNEWPDQVFATIRRFISQVSGEDWDYSSDARLVRAPVLVIHGTADPNAPIEGGRDWVTLLPNARLLELPEIGHGPWVEAPSEFFSAVDAFLRANARRP